MLILKLNIVELQECNLLLNHLISTKKLMKEQLKLHLNIPVEYTVSVHHFPSHKVEGEAKEWPAWYTEQLLPTLRCAIRQHITLSTDAHMAAAPNCLGIHMLLVRRTAMQHLHHSPFHPL